MATAAILRVSGGAETHFAKKLASNEKTVRDKAVKKLRIWLSSSRSVSAGLSETDLLKLWKGLFYCMWMSDKPKVQEELAGMIAQLLHNFPCRKSAFDFLAVFFKTMHREWHGIDHLRLDKFYLLIRKFMYESILFLENHSWDEESVSMFSQVLQNGPLNPSPELVEFPSGVQVHIIQVYLDELFKIDHSKISSSILLKLLEPFLRLLARSKSNVITRAISQRIFSQLLDRNKSDEKDGCWTKVDFNALGEQFFSLATLKDIPGRNRNILYDYINKFKKTESREANITNSCEIKGHVVNGIDEPLSDENKIATEVNGKEEVKENGETVVETCSTDISVAKDCKVRARKSKVKKTKEKGNLKRKCDDSDNQTASDSQQDITIDGDLSNVMSAERKRKKLDGNMSSKDITKDERVNPDVKEGKKKKRKAKKIKIETFKDAKVDLKEDDKMENGDQHAHEFQLLQEETSNLDGSYLGTISIAKQKSHSFSSKAAKSEITASENGMQRENGTTKIANLSKTEFKETTPTCSVDTTLTSRSTVGLQQGLDMDGGATNSPPLAYFLRHSLKKVQTEPKKKKERKLLVTGLSSSAPGKDRKQVRIELSKNTSHTTQDYRRSLKSSPTVPFDAAKKPVQSSLKTAPLATQSSNNISNNTCTPFQSIKRPSASDFF